MNKDNPLLDEYNLENGPAPLYRISKDLSDLTLMFIISSVVFFLAAGTLAIIMRTVQSKLILLGNQQQTIGMFYAASHSTWPINVLRVCINVNCGTKLLPA